MNFSVLNEEISHVFVNLGVLSVKKRIGYLWSRVNSVLNSVVRGYC